MNDAERILAAAQTVLVIDWPSRDVPESLARSGRMVVVQGGPGPEDHTAWELQDGEVVVRPVGRRPEHADLVYSYRPLDELPAIVATAVELGAHAIWTQLPPDQSRQARETVEAASLAYIGEPYIAEAVRRL